MMSDGLLSLFEETMMPVDLGYLRCCNQTCQVKMTHATITDIPKVIDLRLRTDDDVISNGVPPPPPNVALGLGVVSVVSAIIAKVDGTAVSTDRGIVVTDVAGAISGSGGITEDVKVAKVASGSVGEVDVVDTGDTTTLERVASSEMVASGLSAELSLIDSGTWLGSKSGVTVIVGWASIPSAVSASVDPRALGQIVVVPSEMKNLPISVSKGAFVP